MFRSLPLLLLVTACGPRALPGAALDDPLAHDKKAPPAPPALFAGIAGHGADLLAARDALRDEDVPTAFARLRDLRTGIVDPGVPDNLRVYVYGLEQELLDLDHVRGVEGAAKIVGAAAAWCGRCHRAAGVPLPSSRPFEEHPYRRMADQAWGALVWPEGNDWPLLAAALAPAAHDAVPADAEAPLAVIARALRDVPLGNESTVAVSDRVDVFAKVQASCGACHSPKDEADEATEDVIARR